MPTEADVMSLFERANPVPDPEAIDIVVGADERLATVLHETSNNVAVIESAEPEKPAPRRRGWMIPAAAAAALVLALVTGLSIFAGNETEPSDSIPPTIAPPTTTVPGESAAQPSAEDLALVDMFIGAYNAGDTEAVLKLTDDIVVTEQYGGRDPDPDHAPHPNPEALLAWKLAQGEILTEATCEHAASQPATGSTLSCAYGTISLFVQVDDSDPIPTLALLTIVDGVITELHQGYGLPDDAAETARFRQWIEQNHPELLDSLFGDWTSRAEAEDQGRLRAEWVRTWARTLDEPDQATILDGVAMAPTLPAPTDGETQQTIVGDITWTRLDGDATTQPEVVDFELHGYLYGRDLDGTGWRSSDGIEWAQHELPLETLSDVVDVRGQTWAVGAESDSRSGTTRQALFRWDGTSFESFELPPSGAPTVDGFRQMSSRLTLIRFDDRLVIVSTETHDVSWDDIFGEPGWAPESIDDGTVSMRNYIVGGRTQVETTVDEDNPGTIQVTRDGQLLGRLGPWPGIESDDVLALLADDRIAYGEVLIGGTDGFRAVRAPSPLTSFTDVAVLGDRLLALLHAPGSDGQELWVTDDDGATWVRRDLPRPRGGVADVAFLTGDGSTASLTVVSGNPVPVVETWHTVDGTTWQVANGAASYDDPFRADFGWLRGNFYDFTGHIAVSPDGITWQEISVGPQTHPSADGGSIAALGDTIIIGRHEGGRRELWIGKVAPG